MFIISKLLQGGTSQTTLLQATVFVKALKYPKVLSSTRTGSLSRRRRNNVITKRINKDDLTSLAALQMTQDRHPRGVIDTADITEGTKMSKAKLKKLVRAGWLKEALVTGSNGGLKRAYYVNPDFRSSGNAKEEADVATD